MKKGVDIFRNKTDFSITLTPEKCYYTLIWLHGLGDSSEGFYDYFLQKNSPLYKGARIKLLQAPKRPVTINSGMVCNSWYDIKTFQPLANQQNMYSLKEVEESKKIIYQHVLSQVNYWAEKYKNQEKQTLFKRIFIGGFSQGCAMSLTYGLTSSEILAGVLGFSGHMFRSFDLKNKSKIPMLVYHGKDDDVIDYRMAKKGYDDLIGKQENFKLKLIQDLPHTVTIQQLKEGSQWISAINVKNKIE